MPCQQSLVSTVQCWYCILTLKPHHEFVILVILRFGFQDRFVPFILFTYQQFVFRLVYIFCHFKIKFLQRYFLKSEVALPLDFSLTLFPLSLIYTTLPSLHNDINLKVSNRTASQFETHEKQWFYITQIKKDNLRYTELSCLITFSCGFQKFHFTIF